MTNEVNKITLVEYNNGKFDGDMPSVLYYNLYYTVLHVLIVGIDKWLEDGINSQPIFDIVNWENDLVEFRNLCAKNYLHTATREEREKLLSFLQRRFFDLWD